MKEKRYPLISKNRWINIFFTALLFVALFIFFYVIHPLVIFDADDWTYIFYSRSPFPAIFTWNPTRILPETLMPAVSGLAAYLIYPITGDYIQSLSLLHALVLCVFIVLYVLLLKKMISTGTNKNNHWSTCCLAVLFFLMHFLIFRTRFEQNAHLFLATDVTCVFYYTIPTLLNFIIVMQMEQMGSMLLEERRMSTGMRAVYVLLIYLAIFSNLYSSIVLAAYAAISLLWDFRKKRMTRQNRIAYLAIVALWIVSGICELTGGRASSGVHSSWIESLGLTLTAFGKTLLVANKSLVLFLAALVVAGICLWVVCKEKKQYIDEYALPALKLMLCAAVTIIYLILLSSVVNPEYISREDVLIAFFGFVFMAVTIILSYFIGRMKVASIALPFVVFVAFFQTYSAGRTFKDTNIFRIRPETCAEIDNVIINQIVSAEKQGFSEIELHVPKYETFDNWPHRLSCAETYVEALYKHGVIQRKIDATLYLDQEMTDKYFLSPDNASNSATKEDAEIQIVGTETPAPMAVDLGLSVKWASFNLGAIAPEEYGDFYAWGEIEPKKNYDWANYKLCKGSATSLTKYNDKNNYGDVDNTTVLGVEEDVAHIKLGGNWRMPTEQEWVELSTKCTWQWVDNFNGSGINGVCITAQNDNNIFLPAAGDRYYERIRAVGYGGYYWSSNLSTVYHPSDAWFLYFNSSTIGRYCGARFCGCSVRPVSE